MESAAANSYGEYYRCVGCGEWVERQAMRAHAVLYKLKGSYEPAYDAYWRHDPEGSTWEFFWERSSPKLDTLQY